MLCLKGWGRLALLLAAVLAGCGGNVTVSRGFGSREVLPARDSTIKLGYVTDVQGQDPVLIYTTQGDDAGLTYWSLDLVNGALQNLGGQSPSATTGPTSTGRYTCQYVIEIDSSMTIQVTDSTTGVETDVAGVSGYVSCPSDDGFLAVFRPDPQNSQNLILWSGPYTQLATIALPINVQRTVTFKSAKPAGADGGAPVPPTAVVVASVPGEPNGFGIYSIDLTTDQVTALVPPTAVSTAWADGAPQSGSLQSDSISLATGISRFNGHYVYARTMSDGGTTLFAGPFEGGAATELALFQLSSIGVPILGQGVRVSAPDDSTAAVHLPAMASWQLDDQSGAAPSQMIVWDDTDARVTVCPSSPNVLQAGVLSPDGTHVLFSAASSTSIRSFGPLQVVTMGPDGPEGCFQLSENDVFWGDYSGDGSAIAWIAKTKIGSDADLWIANGDGSGAQMLFSGMLYGARFITGTNKLELAYGADLVWLDVHDQTLVYVAEQLFGPSTGVAGSWFVGGYNYSTQDASGTLGAIDLDSGKKVQISASVTQYVVSAQVIPSDNDSLTSPSVPTGTYHVAYMVRGRNASTQDGIWVATVQAADLQ
jgi:hypothetical protein